MTVALAAFIRGNDPKIVTVSDRRLSYGEIIPAADDAALKNRKIADRWGTLFAATDATAFMPVASRLRSLLDKAKAKGGKTKGDKVKDDKIEDDKIEDDKIKDDKEIGSQIVVEMAKTAYETEYHERFFREHLARFRYKDVEDFRVGFESHEARAMRRASNMTEAA